MIKRLLLTIVLSLFLISNLYADDNAIKVTASGMGLSKQAALKDALRSALEKASGVAMSTDSIIIDGKLVADKSATYSAGYVKSYNIKKEKVEPPYMYITIEAYVSYDKGETDNIKNNSTENQTILKKSQKDNIKAFEKLITLELPKQLGSFENALSLSVTEQNVLKDFTASITLSIDNVEYESIVNSFISFLSSVGIKETDDIADADYFIKLETDTLGDYKILPVSSDIFQSFKKITEKYINRNIGKRFALTFKDKNNKSLDVLTVNTYNLPIIIEDNIINIGLHNQPFIKNINEDMPLRIIENVTEIICEISDKKGLGYFLGISGAVTSGNKGVAVLNIQKNSPAQIHGIQASDIITEINGMEIYSNADIKTIMLNASQPYATIKVLRNSQAIDIEVELQRKDSNNNYI